MRRPPSPDHPAIRHLQALKQFCDPCSRDAVDVAIDSIRALAETRPKHPTTVVGQSYAVLYVSHAALRAGQKALGDFDLGPPDLAAMRAAHADDRAAHYDDLGREETGRKWGRP